MLGEPHRWPDIEVIYDDTVISGSCDQLTDLWSHNLARVSVSSVRYKSGVAALLKSLLASAAVYKSRLSVRCSRMV